VNALPTKESVDPIMKGLAYGAPVAASVKDTNKGKNNEAAPMIPARSTYASEKSL